MRKQEQIKIVTSPEKSKWMQGLGIVQESHFYWVRFHEQYLLATRVKHFKDIKQWYKYIGIECGFRWECIEEGDGRTMEIISAWTLQEVAIMTFSQAIGINGGGHPDGLASIIKAQLDDGDYTIKEMNETIRKWREK